MLLKIDTDKKVIIIIGSTPILEVLKFLEGKDLSDWSIESEVKIHIVEKQTPSIIPPTINIPYIYIPETDPYCPPYIVTCSSYSK